MMLLILSVVAALTVALSACSTSGSAGSTDNQNPAPEAAAPAAILVTDMAGSQVSLDGPAKRVVAITPSDCEIIYALGAGDALVGRGTYCNYPKEIESVPVVQSGNDMNAEQIIALAPQVVVVSTMNQQGMADQIQGLKNAGIAVVLNDATTIDDTYKSIGLLGSILGKDSEASALVNKMKQSFDDIKAKATGDGTKTIYFEVSPLQYGLWTAGSGTFEDEIATMLGLKNAFADVSSWQEISAEQVIERNPDYIVTIFMFDGQGETPVQEIMGRPGWDKIAAVKNNAVFNADENTIARPGPRLVNAAEDLYEFVYGAVASS
ncbi:MAG: ABC transporter substrate-binding protein [Actinomycetia bacterium]|nr:ABC transporter substrate-binding protein [Actinomycetes bacterium]